MTTSITAINAGSSAASEAVTKKSSLSSETKAKLESLGITATDGMTEAEAQAKISEAEARQNPQNQDEGGQEQGNSSEAEIMADVKSLASKVGVSVASDADVSEILDDISSELEVMLEEAENNPSILAQLSEYLSELTSLDDQYQSIQNSQASMYSAMNMISTNNKIALGLT